MPPRLQVMPHFVGDQDGHHGAEIDGSVLDHADPFVAETSLLELAYENLHIGQTAQRDAGDQTSEKDTNASRRKQEQGDASVAADRSPRIVRTGHRLPQRVEDLDLLRIKRRDFDRLFARVVGLAGGLGCVHLAQF